MAMKTRATLQEVLQHASLITRVFRTGLARAPEPAALQDLSLMLNKGGGIAALAQAVADSEEFNILHGNEERCDEAYVTQLFRNGLDRDPEPEAMSAFLAGGTRAQLLAGVADSAEALKKTDLLKDLFPDGPPPTDALAYALWLDLYDRLDEIDLLAISHQIDTLKNVNKIALLMAAGTARPDLVLETVRSLEAQFYPHWTLYIACAPDLPTTVRSVLQATAVRVPGIVLVDAPPDAGLGDLWQAALARADEPLVAFLDAGDRLPATALLEIASAFDDAPHLDLLYSDEDSIDAAGYRFAPLFKAGWSSDMLLLGDVIGQLAVIRRTRILDVGGVREDGGSHARHDLLLRVTQGLHAGAILHLPSILYHRGRQPGRPLPFPRSRNTSVHPDVVRTVARHLTETSDGLTVADVYIGGDVWPRVIFPLPVPLPRVSILIPTRDQPDLLCTCVAGLLERTTYPDIEVLIANNGSETAENQHLLRRLARDPRVRVERLDIPFNWSALNNRLAAHATGDVFVLMNDDVDVIEPDWLNELIRQLARPGVGIAGARLLYPDGSLQHGGVVLDDTGVTHVLRSAREEEPGYMGQLVFTQDRSAVTGACLAVRRDVFEAIKGVDEGFAHTCNDIDLCLRARAGGYRVVWTPHAVLTHLDGASRGADDSIARLSHFWRDLRRLHDRWGEAMDVDPFLNANLLATDHYLVLATPPRWQKSWQSIRDALEAKLPRAKSA